MIQNPHNIKKRFRLSRKARLKRSPIPWIVLLIASGILIYWVFPSFSLWREQLQAIAKYEKENPALEEEIKAKKLEEQELKNQFEKEAKEVREKEEQLFPKKIDTSQVAQILELYSILLKQAEGRGAIVELKSLSFGNSMEDEEEPYTKTPVTMVLRIDKQSLKQFIKFLQKGTIPEDLQNRIINKTLSTDPAALDFLQENRLPVTTIQSINLSKERVNLRSPRKVYNAQIQFSLFSQKLAKNLEDGEE